MWLPFVVAVLTFFYIFRIWESNKKKKEFWQSHGVPFIDISKFTNTFELLLGIKGTRDVDKYVYEQIGSDKKFCGILESGLPILIVKDLDLAKDILIKDFDHFVDHAQIPFKDSQFGSLSKMLPALHGSQWRGTRLAVSPAFTTGRIKRIMEYFNSCGVEWTTSLKNESSEKLNDLDIQAAAGQYATDVIASSVFGLNVGSIKDPNSRFMKMAVKTFGDTSWSIIIRQCVLMRFPKIAKLLGLEMFDKEATQFFDEILENTLRARERGEVSERNDFIQFLVEARKGMLKEDNPEDLDNFEKEAEIKDKPTAATVKKYLYDDDVVKGQGFIFFFAGFHGVAMSASYAIHALSHFPDVQEKLRKELEGKFGEDGTIQYEVLTQELPYLEMVISEIMRFYPVTPRMPRLTTKEYNRPDLNLHLPKGTEVGIPLAQIHRDPKHYPNPDQFNPEKFTPENKAKRHTYAYMPFGHGPRNCIGMRFALVEVKTAVAHIVHNFKIEKAPGSTFPVKTVLIGPSIVAGEKIRVKLIPISK